MLARQGSTWAAVPCSTGMRTIHRLDMWLPPAGTEASQQEAGAAGQAGQHLGRGPMLNGHAHDPQHARGASSDSQDGPMPPSSSFSQVWGTQRYQLVTMQPHHWRRPSCPIRAVLDSASALSCQPGVFSSLQSAGMFHILVDCMCWPLLSAHIYQAITCCQPCRCHMSGAFTATSRQGALARSSDGVYIPGV